MNNTPKELQLEQMEVQADMLHAFSNASELLLKINNALILLDFNDDHQVQSFYRSLYYFADGVNCLKRGFYNFAESNNINLVNPID